METDSLSDYEKLRLKNIQRNLEFLNNIGLSGSYSLINVNKPTRPAKVLKDPSILSVVIEPSRRSIRIAALQDAAVDVGSLYFESAYDGTSSSKRHKVNNHYDFDKTDINTTFNSSIHLLSYLPSTNSQSSSSLPSPSSSSSKDPLNTRNLTANYSQFINHLTLGKQHYEFGKASVVTQSNNGIPPKFSKYSGVLEWSNCVFLWVNLGGQVADGGYDNTFLDDGHSFVWFGGNKMTKESSVIQRLLRAGLVGENTASSSSSLTSSVASSSSSSSSVTSSVASSVTSSVASSSSSSSSLPSIPIKNEVNGTYNSSEDNKLIDSNIYSSSSSIPIINSISNINDNSTNTNDNHNRANTNNTNNHSISDNNSNANDSNNHNSGNNTNTYEDKKDVILLFVRIVGEPYACLGTLSTLNCNFNIHPLVIHWRLNEYDQLMNGSSKDEFQRILNVSPRR